MKYNFSEIEKKWQKYWEENKTFKAEIDKNKPKFYCLDFFPYPSSEGLHVGHVEGYTASDIMARYKRMRGFNVLHPMGWDAFGLQAEQFAVKKGIHPKITVKNSAANFKRQLKSIGFSYDWDREINTTDPKYYKWTQWIFLQLYKKGLAYEAEVPVNWCPEIGAILANEEVPEQLEKGYTVERRPMRQWMLKITEYAERLLKDLELVDWPDSTKEMQKNWIGKSEGAMVKFNLTPAPLSDGEGNKLGYITTDPSTWSILKERVKDNRANPTAAEAIMWELLRNRKMGFKFRRQHAVGKYIGDFVCIERKLIIEIDGSIHKVRMKEDELRTKDLERQGFRVVRITNKEIFENLEEVILKIKNEIEKAPLSSGEGYGGKAPLSSGEGYGGKVPLSSGEGYGGEVAIEIFTTRPDTLWGATYMVLAPEHPLVNEITTKENKEKVESYKESIKNKSELERQQLEKEKTGEFTGGYAVNPVNNEKIPVWISDYVMMGYGTGAIMAVPGHDQRDWEFAKKFNLPIIEVVQGGDISKEAFTEDGVSVNSGIITGLKTTDAKKKIIQWLEENNLGRATVQYKLRDWLFSRQRYWGEPIPVIHLKDGTVKTLDESELPLTLPEVETYKPTGTGESPLAGIPEWVNTIDKETGLKAKRETNTMPQWAGSCWYYLRFLDPDNNKEPVSKENEKYWMPVDFYLGGAEHAVLHLLYARFWHKVLYDLGYVSTAEPFMKLHHPGMILGDNFDKMSKSMGNVVNPDDLVMEYGADVLRMFEMFLGPLSAAKPWSTQGIEGISRFLNRVWRLFVTENGGLNPAIKNIKPDEETDRLINKTIKEVTEDIENKEIKFNTAISELMIFINEISKKEALPKAVMEKFLKLLSPFAPHLAEELWNRMGHTDSMAYESWPGYDPEKITTRYITVVGQVNGKVRTSVEVEVDTGEQKLKEIIKRSEKIQKYINGKEIVKEIVVKNKLVNIVIK